MPSSHRAPPARASALLHSLDPARAGEPLLPRQRVFLNVPYDDDYAPLFLALVGTLVALGRRPVCALELPEDGPGRCARILGLIRGCPVSLHDLSRVQLDHGTPRFNMPFELGMASALSATRRGSHRIVILEEVGGRLARSISDLHEMHPLVHRRRPRTLARAVLGALARSDREVSPADADRIVRALHRDVGHPFDPERFRTAVREALQAAEEAGLLRR